MEIWQLVATIVGSVAASGAFWALVQSRIEKRSAATQLMLGLAHERLIELGMQYLERGWITKDEYDDFVHYLWNPYSKFGGNGLADKVKRDVDSLPIYSRQSGPVMVKVTEKEQHDNGPTPQDASNSNE